MATKKKTAKTATESSVKTEYVMPNGDRYEVIGEDGKYYYCSGKTQFRKSAKRGVIERTEAEKRADEPQYETEG